jgi:hypothetical protein
MIQLRFPARYPERHGRPGQQDLPPWHALRLALQLIERARWKLRDADQDPVGGADLEVRRVQLAVRGPERDASRFGALRAQA